MPTVRLPSPLQALTGGTSSVEAKGSTLRNVIDDLERRFPGLRARIIDAGSIRDEVMIAIGSDEVRDLDTPLPEDAEVYIVPAIAGG